MRNSVRYIVLHLFGEVLPFDMMYMYYLPPLQQQQQQQHRFSKALYFSVIIGRGSIEIGSL